MSYVRIFDKDSTDFSTRGLGVLNNVIICYVEEYLNGAYDCFLQNPIYDEKADLIQNDRIIVCSTPIGFQAFRIYKTSLDDAETCKQAYARHIYYDNNDNFVEGVNMQRYMAVNAVKHIMKNTVEENNFIVSGDALEVANLEIVRENPVEAIMGDADNSIVNRYNCEIKRDNWNIYVLEKYERDNPVKLKYARDYYGLKVDTDFTNIVTKVMPEGFDGLFLPEKYVVSDNIDKYKHQKIRVKEFNDIKAITNEYKENDALPLNEAYEALRKEAKKLFTDNKIDLPEVTLNLNYTNLSKTEEFKKYAYLFKLLPFDRVIVEHIPLNLSIETKMNYYNWNCLTDEYNSLQFGSTQKNLASTINKAVNKSNTGYSIITEYLTDAKDYTDSVVDNVKDSLESQLVLNSKWSDNNTSGEDRTGYIVAFASGACIKKATSIPQVIGVTISTDGINSRVATYGVCTCLQDGTLSVGDYIGVIDGIATKSDTETKYIAVGIIDSTHIKIIMR